ncbi:MAG: PadR family transcriptional regulator [Candidatus Dormibacteraeota bacterium]|nr:PadR family transcriptional regulator [Candidatus Dormibacteraeota bacterium]MBO0744477.1 PadR family transcriptional regulator [Candidatus Dormibacteraeota bacterium]
MVEGRVTPRHAPPTTGEWAVLGLLAEGPAHGFALAKQLQPDGSVGRVWSLRTPLVYRAIQNLTQKGLVEVQGEERSDIGPQRRLVAITERGRALVEDWLRQPVAHTRDVRSALMLKLALADHLGRDARPLLQAQRERLRPQLEGLEQRLQEAEGFDRVLVLWRVEAVRSVLRFLDEVAS